MHFAMMPHRPSVDRFYVDDAWSDKPDPPPRGQPPSYRSCDSSAIGGPTEEDAHCVTDMGLTQADTTAMVGHLSETMAQVKEAIIAHGGFSTRMMPAYAVHAVDDPALDPRPPARCIAFMRRYCRPDNPNMRQTFTYEARPRCWKRPSFRAL